MHIQFFSFFISYADQIWFYKKNYGGGGLRGWEGGKVGGVGYIWKFLSSLQTYILSGSPFIEVTFANSVRFFFTQLVRNHVLNEFHINCQFWQTSYFMINSPTMIIDLSVPVVCCMFLYYIYKQLLGKSIRDFNTHIIIREFYLQKMPWPICERFFF